MTTAIYEFGSSAIVKDIGGDGFYQAGQDPVENKNGEVLEGPAIQSALEKDGIFLPEGANLAEAVQTAKFLAIADLKSQKRSHQPLVILEEVRDRIEHARSRARRGRFHLDESFVTRVIQNAYAPIIHEKLKSLKNAAHKGEVAEVRDLIDEINVSRLKGAPGVEQTRLYRQLQHARDKAVELLLGIEAESLAEAGEIEVIEKRIFEAERLAISIGPAQKAIFIDSKRVAFLRSLSKEHAVMLALDRVSTLIALEDYIEAYRGLGSYRQLIAIGAPQSPAEVKRLNAEAERMEFVVLLSSDVYNGPLPADMERIGRARALLAAWPKNDERIDKGWSQARIDELEQTARVREFDARLRMPDECYQFSYNKQIPKDLAAARQQGKELKLEARTLGDRLASAEAALNNCTYRDALHMARFGVRQKNWDDAGGWARRALEFAAKSGITDEVELSELRGLANYGEDE